MRRAPLITTDAASRQRIGLDVDGAVQGVGFRPFVHRLAVSEGLAGFVCNTDEGVSLEVEGPASALDRFLRRLDAEIEPPAAIRSRHARQLAVRGDEGFAIAASARGDACDALVLPDLATCALCRAEIFDPADRRYRYPFTTCVHCGPRYSIIEGLPYDRIRTTMRRFSMCRACRAEYDDPASRRFHAETNACPDCGPRLALWDSAGKTLAIMQQALAQAAEVLRQGRILALKGLGGFQLIVDARNEAAVDILRDRKSRPAKPFAIMVPDLAGAGAIADISAEEEALLRSPAAPIVLLQSRADSDTIAANVAPANPRLGVMLPYTPLHHLLMAALGFPIVATSGNRGNEPIITDGGEALEKLAGIADLFLVHDRPILSPVDDSVVRVIARRETILRRARGYAPLSLRHVGATVPTLALGGHQKSTVAAAFRGQIVLGPHIGDLASVGARAAFARAIRHMAALHDIRPERVACDTHPDYHSTHIAEEFGCQVCRVPHHLAHVLAGMIDNNVDEPVLGVAWDGTGYGADGTIWGGEFLSVDDTRYRRIGHLLPFRLPGGDAAIREPRRAALGALYATYGASVLGMTDLKPIQSFAPPERKVLATMLARGINAPVTSSAGRLFDAVASILGLSQKTTFEGEAAMALEFAAERATEATPLLSCDVVEEDGMLMLDWRPLLKSILEATHRAIPAADIAAGFHDRLAEAITGIATRLGRRSVLLTGGCFQNGQLTARAVFRLREAGLDPYWHHGIPPNDGGLAVGQAVFAAQPLIEEMA